MGTNRGKKFEECVKNSFEKVPNTSVDRLLDPMAGYTGVRNICDFIVYKYPLEYYIECKSHYGNTLPFSCITENQWNGLLQKSKIKGVIAGVIIWFMDKDLTVFVPIQTLQELKNNGAKSFNATKDISLPSVYIVPGKKKRIFFNYEFENFLEGGN